MAALTLRFRHFSEATILGFLCFVSLHAQAPGITVVGSSYESRSDGSRIVVAPGQIVPLAVTGLRTILPGRVLRAAGYPLPITLAGISVKIHQANRFVLSPSDLSVQVPLLSLEQASLCTEQSDTAPDCQLTTITIQIPYDLEVIIPNFGFPYQALGPTELTITENNGNSKSFALAPYGARPHIRTSCDAGFEHFFTVCGVPAITHADGVLVSREAPAKPGEVVMMYLVGLGPTSPAAPTGTPLSVPADAIARLLITYKYDAKSVTTAAPETPTLTPIFAGLAAGQVGLYQIEFAVPSPPEGTQPCDSTLRTNLTINLQPLNTAPGSADSASFCVSP